MNFRETLPKASPAGSLHLEWKRCGRGNCRCSRGLLHGPYLYHHWRERGRQKKAYVAMACLTEVLEAIERQRAWKPKIAEILRLLKEPSHA